MRISSVLAAALLLTAAAPPREQSPASQEALAEVGAGTSDEALDQAVAAAAAFPLGSIENPVRAGGPDGARAYIARLRCGDGSRPRLGTSVSGGTGGFGTLVEIYPLNCAAASPGQVRLHVDYYHEGHVEDRPIPGFTIMSR